MFFSEIMDYVVSCSENTPENEVPIFAVVAVENKIISESSNKVEELNRPWLHAEFLAIEKACDRLKTKYLDMASLYVNLEPCSFCAAMLEKIRIKEIFFGAYDPKGGAIVHNSRLFDYSPLKANIIGGIQEEKCSKIISDFFQKLRIK